MKFDLNRAEIETAIKEYIVKKVVMTGNAVIEVTQSKSAKATVTISEPKVEEDAG